MEMNKEKKKILFVDDSVEIIEMVSIYLEDDYDLVVAHNGVEALEKLIDLNKNNVSVSMIITDVDMPLMTGPEFIDKLREFPEFDNIPKIIMTGSNHEESKNAIISRLLSRLQPSDIRNNS